MRIDLYATCWNDARMLGFFFRHYEDLVQRFVIFDDGSTDGSVEILRAHPKVVLRRWERADPASFVLSEQHLSDHCWKESRGEADWVMVLDLDEHLQHDDLLAYLQRSRANGVTVVPALGFQMLTATFPQPNEKLSDAWVQGAPWIQMCKCSLFDPNRIEEINFTPGRHCTAPSGDVLAPARDELLNLHYKYLGLSYVRARHRELHSGLGATDLAKRWGHKYKWDDSELLQDWAQTEANLVNVTRDPLATAEKYPFPVWWEKWPRADLA